MDEQTMFQPSDQLAKFSRALLFSAILLILGGCTQGMWSDGVLGMHLMSSEREKLLGVQSHTKILARNGGAYKNKKLQTRLDSIISRLVRHSKNPELKYRLTILDQANINAFALPGGYIYVTRGLLALVNDEAELAGVLAHELSHITAQHTAKRHMEAFKSKMFSGLLGGFIGTKTLARAFWGETREHIARYSRQQEFEADRLGIKMALKAGFQPDGSASFLLTLTQYVQAQAVKAAIGTHSASISTAKSHPAIIDRISRARAFTKSLDDKARHLPRRRNAYLTMIDGMVFGGNQDGGFVKNGFFVHPRQGFRFPIPKDFHLRKSPHFVLGFDKQGSFLFLDSAKLQQGQNLRDYLQHSFAKGVAITKINDFRVNNMSAIEGYGIYNGHQIRLVILQYQGNQIYRFLLAVKSAARPEITRAFNHLLWNFRKLTPLELDNIRPLRVRIVTIRPQDTIRSLARKMKLKTRRVEQFRILNGLHAGVRLKLGDKVKIIAP